MSARESRRRAALSEAGAAGEVLEELLAYGEPLLPDGRRAADPSSLGDEPQVAAWCEYEAAARRDGAVAALSRAFPQLLFPVRAGISAQDGYRAATRRGEPAESPDGPPFVEPGRITLEVARTLAGRIPILVAARREDFETLVRVLSARNEPVKVPASMGSCLVRGLPNWDRVARFRARWEEEHPLLGWDTGFTEMTARKELYEDRFIVLSSGAYSGVAAEAAGFPEEEWRALSLAIRREHEATHYLTLRAAGTMRTNVYDELLADWAALVRTFGRYDARLALLFLGLEAFPRYREGGRLQNYRGGLSDAAFAVAQRLVHRAVGVLEREGAEMTFGGGGEIALARRLLRLSEGTLEELATGALPTSAALRLTVPGDRDGIARAMSAFDDMAPGLALAEGILANLRLVLDEVLSNQVKYGWPAAPGHVQLRIERTETFVELEFVDDGRPFDVLGQRPPDTSSGIQERAVGGLGIYLVKRLTDEQLYERLEGKNRLLVRKRL